MNKKEGPKRGIFGSFSENVHPCKSLYICQWSLFWIKKRCVFNLKKINPKTFGPDCVHTYVCTCMNPYIHPYMHTSMHAYIHTCMHTYIHTWYIHIYIHTCIHTCIHTYVHTLLYIHIYMQTYMYVHFTDPVSVIRQLNVEQIMTTQQKTHTDKNMTNTK
jgi:hypothetical protein